MKYLKKFEEKALYESYISDSPILPNVSYIEGVNEMFYNQAPSGGPVIDTIGKENGVYAVTSDGKLIDYNSADSSCIGVALITDNQRIMIPKANATDGTTTILYWGYNLYQKNVAGITETSEISIVITDFNGKANTDAIIAAYSQHSVDMDSRDMCKVLSTYTEGGFTDWYVPAAGQLYEIYINKADINAALANIGGIALSTYWSSSEKKASSAWWVDIRNGNVDTNGKNYANYQVRFIRDI